MEYTAFRIRQYGRMELAQVYSPTLCPEAAWRRLHKWIQHHPTLPAVLASLGYDGSTRSFSPAQVQAIVDALGEP